MDKIVLIHGDVTLFETDSIPKTAKKIVWKPGFVLEKGEGVNTHTIENDCDIFVDEVNSRMYLREKSKPIQVNHNEHKLKSISTQTGIVYKELERVFDYESMEARNTKD